MERTTRIHDLPQEILSDILSRLPAESLISNKVVSKLWCDLISDTKFVDAHLTRSRHQWEYQQALVSKCSIQNLGEKKHELINFTQAKYQVSKLDFELEKYFQFQSSCDGLLLFRHVYNHKQMYVLNPATHKCRVLPILVTHDKIYNTYWTLIYDTSIQKYTVVGISIDMKRCYLYTLDSFHGSSDDNVAIWRELVMPYEESCILSEPMMVNNKLHWLGLIRDSKEVIMYTMDVSKEEIVKTKVPLFLQSPYIWGENAIIELMGSLCLTDYSKILKQLDIWTLQDAGRGQWTKRSIPYDFEFLKGHAVRTSICQNKILVSSKNRIYIYDLKNKDWQTIRLPVQEPVNAYFVHTNGLVKWG